MSPITIPQSIFLEGQWFDAHWLAEVADDTTGELIITATTTTPARIIALRMTTDLVRQLRVMAGFDIPLPVDQARAADESPATQAQIRQLEERLAALETAAEEDAQIQRGILYLRQNLADATVTVQVEDAIDAIDAADAAVYDEFHVEWERDEWRSRANRFENALDAIYKLEAPSSDDWITEAQRLVSEALEATNEA